MPEDEYRHERVRDPEYFDPRSIRTVVVDDHRVVVGCKKGHWDEIAERCEIGTEAQAILHPKDEENPCFESGFIWIEEMLGELEELARKAVRTTGKAVREVETEFRRGYEEEVI